MLAVKQGETVLSDEFRKLFEAEFGFVCRALRRLGVHEGDLPDVAQELFVTVHRRISEFDRSRAPRPWLFSFAVRYASNYRRLARHDVVSSDAPAVPHAGGADSGVEARDLVLRALAKLTFERRTVIVMHDLEGFPAPDIASDLGVPLNTVYSRLRLARADFRIAVEDLQRVKGSKGKEEAP